MDYTAYKTIPPSRRKDYSALLAAAGLIDEGDGDVTILANEEDELMGCASLRGNVIKQLAVSPAAEGGGLAASLVSRAVTEGVNRGETHLFIYTKPKHEPMMVSMGFSAVFETADVLMMENRKDGFSAFMEKTRQRIGCETDGAIVCNCNPFTLGHRHLIKYAAEHCAQLVVFVLSEDKGMFPVADRLALVRAGTSDLANVHVVEGGRYIISRATFPMYFLKEQARAEGVRSDLDLLLFRERIAPALGIKRRFVGEEPFDAVTRAYNERMKQLLPEGGIKVTEIPRYSGISASKVRKLISEGNIRDIKELVPDTTYEYCISHFG